jgi:tRNA(His) 5'-end guanylyltransferase
MKQTMVKLVKETNANMGYTQSDEITLTWHSTDIKSKIWFDGRVSKMTSQLGALATLYFYQEVLDVMPEYAHRLPTFDARVWNVPNRTEGANVFLWREWDATKNSVSMAASAHFSPKELHGKNSKEKIEMLHTVGVNYNDLHVAFKRGTYAQKQKISMPFTVDELEKLQPKHAARTNPNLVIERHIWTPIVLPPLERITNREELIYNGASYTVG